VLDVELGAAVAPVEAAIAGPVVGEDLFDRDALVGEPRDGAVQERDAVLHVSSAAVLHSNRIL
jgi:hypothetical protein